MTLSNTSPLGDAWNALADAMHILNGSTGSTPKDNSKIISAHAKVEQAHGIVQAHLQAEAIKAPAPKSPWSKDRPCPWCKSCGLPAKYHKDGQYATGSDGKPCRIFVPWEYPAQAEGEPLPNQISGVMVKGAYAFGYTTPAPEVSPGTAPAPDPDVERVWKEFWVPIVAPNGVIDMEQVKKELFDLHTAIENVPKVYSHITGGALSKINYLASTVIAAADDHWNESLKEERKEWEEENAEPQAEGEPLTVPGPADKPASRYGVDILYLIREISALVGTLDNRSGDEIARYLRRLADVADTAPVPEVSPAPTKRGGFVVSRGEEIFSGEKHETKEAAMASAALELNLPPGAFFFLGQSETPNPVNWMPDADEILNSMGERAYEEAGECAEDWPDVTEAEKELLTEAIQDVISKWMAGTNNSPRFYLVRDVEKLQIPTPTDPADGGKETT